MCGRMTLTRRELVEIADELGALFEVSGTLGGPPNPPATELRRASSPPPHAIQPETTVWRARYNVAPTDAHPVLRADGGRRRLELARWGVVGGPRQQLLINARSESARGRPAFREALARRRCVIPADGFFEWKKDGERRQPLWFHRPDGKLLLFAGLWEPAPADGDGRPRFVVLTTAPNALVRDVHDRMPAILTLDEALAWLAAPSLELLRPAPEGLLAARPVSSRVNSVRNDDPACLDPPPPVPAASQLALFR